MVRNHWFLWILHLNSWEQKWQDLLIFLERDFPKFRFTGESVLVRITLVLLLPWWLSWKRIPLQCRKCKRCRYNPWVGKIPWRRKWQLTPIFLPGKSHGQGNLAGSSPWGHKRVAHDLATKQQAWHYYIKSLSVVRLYCLPLLRPLWLFALQYRIILCPFLSCPFSLL